MTKIEKYMRQFLEGKLTKDELVQELTLASMG